MITDIFFGRRERCFLEESYWSKNIMFAKQIIDLKINDCQKWVDIDVYNVKIVFKIQLLMINT